MSIKSDHPITPPPELVREWQREANHNEAMFPQVATLAAQWGADQELDACCEWLEEIGPSGVQLWGDDLRKDRRPKPPSLEEQALLAIDTAVADDRLSADVANIVRRALEALPND